MSELLIATLIKPLVTIPLLIIVYFLLVRYAKVERTNAEGVKIKYPIFSIIFLFVFIPILIAIVMAMLPKTIAGLAGLALYIYFMKKELKSAGADKKQTLIVMGGFFGFIIIGTILWKILFSFVMYPLMCNTENDLGFIQLIFLRDCISHEILGAFKNR
jgi:hypothetical protein